MAIAFSADHLSAKTISADTVGRCETIKQFRLCPATGSMADWISAAVVPGAKLLPTTVNGPELVPLMEIPPGFPQTVACPFVSLRAAARRLVAAFRGAPRFRAGPDGAWMLFFLGFKLAGAGR